MSMRYRTQAINKDGGEGETFVPDGLAVAVSSPLNPDQDTSASNPEQLLALAWATCLNATAQVIAPSGRRTAVRVEVELHDAAEGVGYEFHADAYLSVEGASAEETEQVLVASHARCPVSKLLKDAATARVHAEPYAIS
ncbi:OsmC family protein [Microbacterium paludicola]|uniref:OsmC family protein n=1 Tax=Microbacterium paludicola TaxID=300019 RepID=UPI0011A94182|nr:OsmC family protein [Microbacterium paludicola]